MTTQRTSLRASPPARPAFSLIEMIAVMAGLQVFLALLVGALWAAIRIERSAAADFQRTLVHGALADQFRADVAAASSAPKKLDNEAAGPRLLILRRADGKEIVYRWDGQRLERSAGAARQLLPLASEQADVEFTPTADGRLITLRLTETHGQGNAARTDRVEIAAALGGDLQ